MKIVDPENLPKWVRDLYAEQPTRFLPGLWTIDDSGDYHMWSTLGSFHKLELEGKTLPGGIKPADVVDWYALPSWVKGSYSSEAEMERLQSYTWVRGNLSGTEYHAYEPNGRYAGKWARE